METIFLVLAIAEIGLGLMGVRYLIENNDNNSWALLLIPLAILLVITILIGYKVADIGDKKDALKRLAKSNAKDDKLE